MADTIHTLLAGAAEINITPHKSLHLEGYPFAARKSTGVNDPLLSTALYITDGTLPVLFIGNDVIFTSKAITARVRREIHQQTGIPTANILISATHTHSGPGIVAFAAGSHDALLPKPDEDYIREMEAGMVAAACKAYESAVPAKIGLAMANATGIGTNRQNPEGPADLDVPVMIARSTDTGKPIGVMLICNMHPTVLHEDSTVYSGDFPGLARQILQKELLTIPCPVLYHTGAAGNQSPRYVTKGNNLAETKRLGTILAQAVAKTFDRIQYTDDITTGAQQYFVDLPKKQFPGKEAAKTHEAKARQQLDTLQREAQNPKAVRSAEVNWFGAVELVHLCELKENGTLDGVYQNCLPAEVQVLHIGPWCFVGWPGEVFIEYMLQVKQQHRNVFVITLANGELQGYIVTKEAAAQGGYEASNAIFDHSSGDILVATTLRALAN